jgi:hypothetical protein
VNVDAEWVVPAAFRIVDDPDCAGAPNLIREPING